MLRVVAEFGRSASRSILDAERPGAVPSRTKPVRDFDAEHGNQAVSGLPQPHQQRFVRRQRGQRGIAGEAALRIDAWCSRVAGTRQQPVGLHPCRQRPLRQRERVSINRFARQIEQRQHRLPVDVAQQGEQARVAGLLRHSVSPARRAGFSLRSWIISR